MQHELQHGPLLCIEHSMLRVRLNPLLLAACAKLQGKYGMLQIA